jgi:subtilisin
MERKLKALILTLLVVVGYEDSSALDVLSQLNKTGDIKMLKHIKEIKAVVLNVPDHRVDELKKLKNVRYVEEDKVAYAVGFGDYADVQWNVKMINAPLV